MKGDERGRHLYPVEGCGRCADLLAGVMLGADMSLLEDHLEDHRFGPSMYPEVEKVAKRIRSKARKHGV